jgi:hypothetical protein
MLRDEERRIRQEVIRDATDLMQKLSLRAYIEGKTNRQMCAGREFFGIEKAVREFIARENGHGRMAIMAEMVALKERRVSTIPPKELSETEPLAEDIQIK